MRSRVEETFHCIEISGCRRICIEECLFRCLLLLDTKAAVDALFIPSGRILSGGDSSEKSPHIWIIDRVYCDCVIWIVRGLLPRIKDNLLKGVVRAQSGNHAFNRIIEGGCTNSNLHGKLKVVRPAEELLILSDGFALVIEDGLATAYPAHIN